MYPVEIQGPRIRLRELRAEDFAAVREYAEDPEVHRHTIWQVDEPADTIAWLAAADASARAPERTTYDLAIADEQDSLLGSVSLGIFARGNAGLGYALRRDRWGTGIASEAARLAIGLAFGALGLRRVMAHVAVENRASARVLERAHMRLEGLVLEHVEIAGRMRDSYAYAITRNEWETFAAFGARALAATGRPWVLERVCFERVEEVHALMSEVGRDLDARFGMNQWSYPHLGEMRHDARRRETYGVRDEHGRLVASFAIGIEPMWAGEPDLDWAPAARALYLNRLMVAPSAQNGGLGAFLMDTIEGIARARRCEAVRLEARADFEPLARFYKRRGYSARWTSAPGADPWPWCALDKLL